MKLDNSSHLKSFIKTHSFFWWWVAEDEKENLSTESVVEATLNYGNTADVKELFEIITVEKVSEIFFRQISGKRANYNKRTQHFFTLYFNKHVQKHTFP